jgi:lysozyme family protein
MAGSPAFEAADAFTAHEEGGLTYDDGLGHIANGGIDQNAHPDIDVTKLTPEQQKAIRYQYWRAVNGDALAAQSPGLALAAYDTAIAAGPAKAVELLKQSGGDPAKYLAERSQFFQHLIASDPEKYERVVHSWNQRTAALDKAVGVAAPQPGAPTSQAPAPSQAAEPENVTAPQAAPAAEKPAEASAAAAAFQPLAAQGAPQPLARSTRERYLELLKQPSAA